MNCRHIDSILDRRAIDVLSAAERANADAHLETCPRCADAWLAHSALAAERIQPARDGLLEQTLHRVAANGRATGPLALPSQPVRIGLAAAAALVLAITALAVLRGPDSGADVAGPGSRERVADASGAVEARGTPASAEADRGAAAAEAGPGPGPEPEATRRPPSPASARYVAGTHYGTFTVPQPTSTDTDHIEVALVFMYGCGGCYAFEPRFEAWEASAADDVEVVRVPAVFDARAALHARAYYTAQALGRLEDMHAAFFTEIHERGNALASPDALGELFGRFGVDTETFEATFDSFAVMAKVARAEQLGRAYRVPATPTLVVDGRYWTYPSMTGSYDTMLDVVDELVANERRNACPAAPPC